MQQSIITEANLTLNEVRKHFDHWRSTRGKRGKVPETLKNEVRSLVGRYPTSQINQTLGVNSSQMIADINKKKSDIAFVEARFDVKTSSTFFSAENSRTCSIEIHRAHGGALKINEFPICSLSTLINQFMG